MECNITKLLEKVKKIGDIFSHVTIRTNVTKGDSMIIQASLSPALYVKSVTVDFGACINHCNKP